MHSEQRGAALVSVVLLLTVLLTLGHVLAEKVWQSTRLVAAADRRQQVFWAARAGLEAARQRLVTRYLASGWRDDLAAGVGQAYPATPAWTSDIDGIAVDVFLRDNADGDDDVRNDNDLRIFVLTRARSSEGTEVMIETLCGLQASTLAGASPTESGLDGLLPDLSAAPLNIYDMAD